MDQTRLLRRAKTSLHEALGGRFGGIVLYGSRARGEAAAGSDVDLIVLVHGELDEPSDSRRCIDALYPLVLETGVLIHAEPVSVDEYSASDFPLYRNVRREGIVI